MRFTSLFMGSFYSAATYRYARACGKTLLGYAVCVVLFSVLLVGLYLGPMLYRVFAVMPGQTESFFDNTLSQIADQVPVMTFKDGVLTTQKPQATIIHINSGSMDKAAPRTVDIATIDTTGRTTSANMTTPMLITASDLVMQTPSGITVKPLSKLMEGQPSTVLINKAVAEDTADTLIEIVHENFGMTVILLILFAIAARICMLLVLGLAAMLMGLLRNTPINYGSGLALACVSYTPIAMLDLALILGFGYSAHLLTLFIAGSVLLFVSIQVTSAPAPIATAQV